LSILYVKKRVFWKKRRTDFVCRIIL
jgi:hypothetical protein